MLWGVGVSCGCGEGPGGIGDGGREGKEEVCEPLVSAAATAAAAAGIGG